MVVLETGGMLSTVANQYLQPDYLSPLPTTLDTKKSPLALLAQTCSQIGSDTPTKSLLSPLEKKKKSGLESSQSLSPSESKHVFKPYDIIVSKTNENSKSSGISVLEDGIQTPSKINSASPLASNCDVPNKEADINSSPVEQKITSRGATPIIRSELEILQENFKESSVDGHKKSLCCASGLDHVNPAFRSPIQGASFSHHQTAVLSNGFSSNTPQNISYARVKISSGGEALVPVCKDAYCTCHYSTQNQQLMLGASSGLCPSGCTQCDHQKYNFAMSLPFVPSGHLTSNLPYSQLGRPYVCSWISGDSYCGKRFISSEELLEHLRSHSNTSDVCSVPTSTSTSLLSPLFSSTALHGSAYSNPALSAVSATRYHPYGKSLLTSSVSASPFSAFNITGLSPYYSPYTTFGLRIGSTAAHP